MTFTVKDLVYFEMHHKISLGIIEVVTDKLIHLRRLEDDEWFMFYDETYDSVKRNFGQISIEDFKEKYPEYILWNYGK